MRTFFIEEKSHHVLPRSEYRALNYGLPGVKNNTIFTISEKALTESWNLHLDYNSIESATTNFAIFRTSTQ